MKIDTFVVDLDVSMFFHWIDGERITCAAGFGDVLLLTVN